uniref:Uncharacterized protein n=1 Tax=Pararge aegeria TaxID=116150 RepID=S4NUR3_9NEOP
MQCVPLQYSQRTKNLEGGNYAEWYFSHRIKNIQNPRLAVIVCSALCPQTAKTPRARHSHFTPAECC